MTFRRTALAKDLAQKLLRPSALDEIYRSGLFLSGARRLGKTTFIREDLIPQLEAQGALVIYVDLWVDRIADPTQLTVAAVRTKLQELTNPLSRTWTLLKKVKELNLKVSAVEFGFTLHDLAQPAGTTLAQAMVELVHKTGLNVVLILDEVQHAVTTESGQNLLHALKAARDAVNLDPERKGCFLVVGTGSHRAKLGELTVSANQAFHGAKSADFPVLGDDFVRYALDRAAADGDQRLPSLRAASAAFAQLGHKPEQLAIALGELRDAPTAGVSVDVHLGIVAHVLQRRAADGEIERVLDMGELPAALFDRVCRARGSYFSESTREQLAEELGVPVSNPMIQSAFKQLTTANIVMRVSHGAYEVTDALVKAAWLERRTGRHGA